MQPPRKYERAITRALELGRFAMLRNVTIPDSAATTPIFAFSTDDYPETERLDAWQELFASKIVGADWTWRSDRPFFASALARNLPDLGLLISERDRAHFQRTRAKLADGDDGIAIAIPEAQAVGRQFGREIVLDPGDAFIVTNTDPYEFSGTTRSKFLGLRLKPTILFPLLRDKSVPPLGRVPHHSEALRLLRGYIRTLGEEPFATSELQLAAASHVYDLVALALGAERDAAEYAKARGLAAARLHEAKAYALAHLRRPNLSLKEIAIRQGVGAHYLRTIFERDGTTFSQFVRDRRLELAHRMLSSARFAKWSISAIAYDVGFGDLSHFNRTFRARYGAAPSDIRTQSEWPALELS